MISNDERREVAARLRNYENLRESFRESPICAFLDALGVEYIDWKGVCNRLADLIEPETERTCKMKVSPGTAWRMCSFCGAFVYSDAVTNATNVIQVRYCPNCGAKVIEQ